MADHWVVLFSKFTPEALLFEALILFFLGAGYAAYWILHRRRATNRQFVPGPVIKEYLGSLITDAEVLRNQLFGLLKSTGLDEDQMNALLASKLATIAANATPINAEAMAKLAAGMPAQVDDGLTQKVQILEKKLAEQAKAAEKISAEKEKLLLELLAAKEAANKAKADAAGIIEKGGKTAGAGADNSKELGDLQARIANLEAKLAEYSIIEDDLANLKRLQQENAQLRAALAEAGKTVPAAAAAPAPAVAVAADAAVAQPEPEPEVAPAAEPPAETAAKPEEPILAAMAESDQAGADAGAALLAQAEASLGVEPEAAAPAAAQAAAAPVAAASPAFEGLVDKVEKSLQPEPTAAPAAAAPAAAAPAQEKSDADLVAEFEKMLSS